MHFDQQASPTMVIEQIIPGRLSNYKRETSFPTVDIRVKSPVSDSSFLGKYRFGSFADIGQAKLANEIMVVKRAKASLLWKKFVLDPSAPATVDPLTVTAEATLDFIAEFGPQALDLSSLEVKRVHSEHLACLLRTASTWRHEVPGWNSAVNVAKSASLLAGLDPEDVLFGMI